MKNILEALGEVGFHEAKDHVGKSLDGQISAEMIVNRFKTRKEVPFDILSAIQNIKDSEKQKKAAVHVLRLTLYARTIQSGGVLSWFENGRVKDLGSNTKIPVSTIKKAAIAFNKVANTLGDTQERINKLSDPKVEISKRQQLSLDKASAKADVLENSLNSELDEFLQALDHVYISSASERK